MRLRSRPSVGSLLLAALLALTAIGCCSEVIRPVVVRPHLPPPPPDRTLDLLHAHRRWSYRADGTVVLPQADLRLVLADRAEWRAWAAAVASSVEWTPPR